MDLLKDLLSGCPCHLFEEPYLVEKNDRYGIIFGDRVNQFRGIKSRKIIFMSRNGGLGEINLLMKNEVPSSLNTNISNVLSSLDREETLFTFNAFQATRVLGAWQSLDGDTKCLITKMCEIDDRVPELYMGYRMMCMEFGNSFFPFLIKEGKNYAVNHLGTVVPFSLDIMEEWDLHTARLFLLGLSLTPAPVKTFT